MSPQDETRNPPTHSGEQAYGEGGASRGKRGFPGTTVPPAISRRSLLNYIAIAILVAGMGSGEFIYWQSLRHGDGSQNDDDSLIRLADSRAYDRAIETQVGTFGLIVNQWDRSLGKLGEPGPLAITICIVSMLAAGTCFMVAARVHR